MTQISSIPICSSCPGFCCKLFFIPTSPEEMRKRLEEEKMEMENLCTKIAAGHRNMNHETIREMSEKIRNLEMKSFGAEHFKEVKGVTSEKTGNRMGEGEGWPCGQYAYTCDQWDTRTGRCMCHSERPWTCQSYVCEAVMEGRVPERKDFPYSAQLTEEQAAEILEFRNTPMCEEKEVKVAEGCIKAEG